MQKKIKVGYLPFYVKLYDDSNPRCRDPMVRYMHVLVDMLESQGLEIVLADEVCRIRPEFERAAEKFNAAQVSAVITQHLAYSPGLESIEALLKLEAPIIVFDTTPDYELISAAGYEQRIDANHGIHGVQEMCNLLKRHGRPYYLCAGHALDGKAISELYGLCRAAAARRAYKTMKVGSAGGSFEGMGDFLISDERYRREIGVEVLHLKPETAAEFMAQVSKEEIDCEIDLDHQKYDVCVTYWEDYRLAVKSGLALRGWMDANGLSACTVNFLAADTCGLAKMPFVECCKILERGQGYAGEGDVLTAGLVGALHAVYPNTTFTEMFCPDWRENVLLLSHMAESNPALARWKPAIRDLDFHYNSCGNTVGMYTCARPGHVVIVNLAPMEKGFTLILCPGELLDCGLERGAYTNATQGWFRPAKPLRDFLKAYSMAGGTHHSAMVYDVDADELRAFGEMMGFDVIVLR